ncbi:hypothetical protein RDV64_23240 (plasmid) [Acuticoccus sp. MNP-M23]|uniref:hypothetical protein n=1 Tax=Acuticoccus sp. MNP-M23 TaxID=3072793 RepID=UPI00281586C7|nr:hypothetical protein [Acuticoccus sp. MNP-M23]WMS45250.1 hypothetical protein RDV64_23240 [Acuticoccus sp. MNP-M23]
MPLDLDKLVRDGLVRPGGWRGSLHWRAVQTREERASADYTAHLDAETGTGTFELRYRLTDHRDNRHDIHQRIELEGCPQRFGGWRWHFRCPATGRRCRKLYLLPGGHYFAARQAWNARYRSQQQAPYDRAIDQAHKLRRRLGAPTPIGDFVPKPRGMHGHTFERHLARLERYEKACDAHLTGFVERLMR